HGTVTTAMLLVNAFQFLYIADYFWHEEAILTTWDIKHEKFGWMLAWGDLVWVPFTYTIQAYYLVDHTHALSPAAAAGIVALNMAGYAIFRASNIQKHRFRRDPTRPVWGRPPEYIRTAVGSLLLTSGWWGIARHLNYLGDLAIALAWGGMAGAGVAAGLDGLGLSTLVVEPGLDGSKRLAGELIHPPGTTDLAELGLLGALEAVGGAPVRGFAVLADGQAHLLPYA